jgi:hypothetical protein
MRLEIIAYDDNSDGILTTKCKYNKGPSVGSTSCKHECIFFIREFETLSSSPHIRSKTYISCSYLYHLNTHLDKSLKNIELEDSKLLIIKKRLLANLWFMLREMENTYKSLGKTKPLDVGTYVIYKKDTDTYVDYTLVIDTLQRYLQNNISVHNIREIAERTMKQCNILYKDIKNATK